MITQSDGMLALIDPSDNIAASWSFSGLLSHWNRKHAASAFVPTERRTEPSHQYAYGSEVHLGTGTEFLRLLRAMSAGTVYYDPGIKLEFGGSSSTTKRRSQFRTRFDQLSRLYANFRTTDVCA